MNFVHLRSFDNYVNANIQLGMLQDRGINCHLRDEYTLTIDPLLSNAIGGMKLMVFETQALRALALIEEAENSNEKPVWLPEDIFGQTDTPIPTAKGPGLLQKLNDMFSGTSAKKD
jgi:hypothetical protein